MSKDYVIYGAGKRGKRVVDEYSDEINIVGFLDRDTEKTKGEYCGKPVYLPEEYKNTDAMVIISVANPEGVFEYLESLGYKNIELYDPNTHCIYCQYEDRTVNYYEKGRPIIERENIIDVVRMIEKYNLISFDIFDTAIFRKVEKPSHIFRIIGNTKKHHDFENIRQEAERMTRKSKVDEGYSGEIRIEDIYNTLDKYYGISNKWMAFEIELEKKLCIQNPWIYKLYNILKEMGKEVVFTSDMYLPLDVIKEILEKNGYSNPKIYLSCEYGTGKSDGGLYKVLINDNKGKRIIHIGDNWKADILNAKEAGIDTYYYADSRFRYNKNDTLNTLDESIYRAVINNNMNNGLWMHDKYYDFGYRIGGILTVGFCQFINKYVADNKIDKVLFCARDCKVIFDVYNKHFYECDNRYIKISRKAAVEIAGERFYGDYIKHSLLQFLNSNGSIKSIECILDEAGFGYIKNQIKKSGINIKLCPNDVENCYSRIQEVLFDQKKVVLGNIKNIIDGAKKYYKEIIGAAKRIVIVDIGWAGTCLVALRQFLNESFDNLEVYGILMCANRNPVAINAEEQGITKAFIHSNTFNREMLDEVYSVGIKQDIGINKLDYLHLALEYLYTSTDSSLLHYAESGKEEENITSKCVMLNANQILSMQEGIEKFSADFLEYTKGYVINVSPYVAYKPFLESLNHKEYILDVLGDFAYDLKSTPTEKQITLFKDVI